MALELVRMRTGDFERRREPMIAGYASAIAVARGLSQREARAQAARDVAERLPRGPATRRQLLRRAMVDGAEVGWIWVSLPRSGSPEPAWISDIEVDQAHRNRGYGAAIIAAAEAELAGLGVPRLGLNVFGDNDTARRLYERLGFTVTAQQRARPLTGAEPPAGLDLLPMTDYPVRIAALAAEHAEQLMREQGIWHGEAQARSARMLAESLPRGQRTPDTILRTVWAEGASVGWLWAALPDPSRPGLGWLHHLGIDECFRGRGYGRRAVAATEAELLRRGVPRLGVTVAGADEDARRFCARLGYTLLAQQMVKDVSPPAR
jgi:ribosomal protein S18 acetylase RimI-like enzyme